MKESDIYTNAKEWVSKSIYAIIVAVVTLAILIIAPFIAGGSETKLSVLELNTAEEWLVYLTPKVLTALGNGAATVCFINQGQLNVKDDPNYKLANEILHRVKSKKVKKPRGPNEFFIPMYVKKMVSTIVTTALGLLVVGELVLNFSVIQFISIMVTEITTVIIGLLGMLNTQEYLTDEYLAYAKMVEGEENEHITL